MPAVRTILHPTDFGPASRAAFDDVCSLAREHSAEVILLHVVPPNPPADLQEMKALLEKIGSAATHPKVHPELRAGVVPAVILEVTDEIQADLVVMGTHSRQGLSRLLIGSVAEEVLRHSRCPVLFVKGQLN
ncbi:universal stress protein [Limnoglobus roseus]|nr:universal stress protein [Limnoglobus roseus]